MDFKMTANELSNSFQRLYVDMVANKNDLYYIPITDTT